MKNMFYLSLLSAACLSTECVASSVVVVTDTVSLQQRSDKQYFSQDGLSGEEAKMIPGAGAGMPLKAAAKILIPANWSVTGSGEFENALISWRGNLTWPQILRDIAQREKIFISLDWVQKTASIHVPANHATLSKNALKPNSSQPEIVVKKIPEAVAYETKIAPTPTKTSVGSSVVSEINKAKQNTLTAKANAASEQSSVYIKKLEADRLALIEKNNAAIKEAERKTQELKLLQSKYAIVDPKKELPAAIDAAELHKMFKSRTVLPFNPSFEYFMKGGHADRFTPETPATFVAKPGTIESVVAAWADSVGYGLEYRAGVQHHNDYEIEIKGSFIEATTELIRAYEESDRPLDVQFYPDVRVSDSKKGLVIISDLNMR